MREELAKPDYQRSNRTNRTIPNKPGLGLGFGGVSMGRARGWKKKREEQHQKPGTGIETEKQGQLKSQKKGENSARQGWLLTREMIQSAIGQKSGAKLASGFVQ